MIHQRKPHNRKLYCLLLSEPKSGAFPCKHKAGKGGKGEGGRGREVFFSFCLMCFILPHLQHQSVC